MSLRFQILGSSSSGNCALIESEGTRVLLDIGFSGRQIEAKLKDCGLGIADIEAVLLTHEHGDHASGARGLSRHGHLKFLANEPTARAVQGKLTREVQWMLFETGTHFRFRDLEIETIRLPHDAYEPVGFIIRSGGDSLFRPRRSIAWLTDLGYVPAELGERVRDVDLLVIEANHDVELLENDMKRPFSVKQRIMGRHGHLSNTATRQFLDSVEQPIWKAVYLAHISKDCNCLNRVSELFLSEPRAWVTHIVDPNGSASAAIDLGVLG